jgi:Kdo2-lipid IVA lauroyltransferase/acyltransferase
MGEKQQGQSKFFSWYHRSFIVRFLLHITPWIMRTLSRKAVHRIRYPFIFLYYCLGIRFRRAVRENLRIALGHTVSKRELRRITRRVFDNVTKSFADSFFVAALPPQRWGEVMEPPLGKQNIAKALEAGKGAIILTGHIGNWEVGGIMLDKAGGETHMVYMPDRFTAFEQARRKARDLRNVHGLPMGSSVDTALRVIRLLSENRIITMKGDRSLNGEGIIVELFGKDTVFPKGPFLVSYISGAPILPAFVVLNHDDRYVPIVEEPIYIERTGDRQSDIRALTVRMARVIEEYIRRYPDQWYMFYPFWKQ